MAKDDRLIERSDELVRRIKPLFAGQGPDLTGVTLAQLLALWLAGHHPSARGRLLALHVGAVRDLTPIADAEIFAKRPRPPSWPPAPLPNPKEQKSLTRKFEDEVNDLIDRYLLDGLTAERVRLVLMARADDDHAQRATELLASKGEHHGKEEDHQA